MSDSKPSTPRLCHKCGIELNQDPITIRILARLDVADRPGTCAECAVDGGKSDLKVKE